MEYASSSSGSGDGADGMRELSATIVCRWGQDGDAPIRCFLELRQGSGATVSTLEIKDPTYNGATKKYLEILENSSLRMSEFKRPVDEAKPIPLLHEHVVRHIAQYVKFSGGIKGLLSFRLVSRMWNEIGTEFFNKEDWKLNLSQRWPTALKRIIGNRKRERTVREFVDLKKSASGGTLSFKTISISHIEDGREDVMKLFLQPGKPWTIDVRLLDISGFNVVEYNEMVVRILAAFPNLESLELQVDTDVYHEDFEDLPRDTAQNRTLKRFDIRFCIKSGRDHRHFKWNFVETCPLLECLSLYYYYAPRNLPELLRMIPKLKTLEMKSEGFDWNVNDRANFVNQVCPANLRVNFYHPSEMTTFFENIVNVSGQVAELYLDLSDSRSARWHDFSEFPIISPQFKVLRVLHLRVDSIIEWGNCFSLGTIETLIEFSIIAGFNINEYEERWAIRSVFRNISELFPNLQIFYGDVVDSVEIKLLLVELAKLPMLGKLTISDEEWDSRNELGFRDGYYQGLRSLSSLVELILQARKSSIGKDGINFIADEMIGLKRLTLRPVTTQDREYAIEKLVKGRRMNVKM